MRIITKKILREFLGKALDCEQQLKAWYQEASKATWSNPNEIKIEYPRASFIGNDRVVFSKKENSYRLIVKINFDYQMVWIRFVGTHAAYDKINAKVI